MNRSVQEAKASIRKYFNDASVVKICLLFDMIGINESELISNRIHALSQEFDETIINTYFKKLIKFVIVSDSPVSPFLDSFKYLSQNLMFEYRLPCAYGCAFMIPYSKIYRYANF
jgi:hypothetical protein